MSEITDVLQAIESLSARGRAHGAGHDRRRARLDVPAARRPAARARGRRAVGNISGGCLEGDVADMARVVMDEGRRGSPAGTSPPTTTRSGGWASGATARSRCSSSRPSKAAEVAGALRMALEEERPICVVTVLESTDDGGRPGRPASSCSPTATPERLARRRRSSTPRRWTPAASCSSAERSRDPRRSTAGVRAFVEVLEPPLRLLICGAGHDAIPLVRAAAALGWSPVVADDRRGFLTHERFPEAAGFVHVERARARGEGRRRSTAHARRRDDAQLPARQGVPALAARFRRPATSACSARRRAPQRLLMELADEGVEIAEADRARIHGPAGLDLGAEGPEEIAQCDLRRDRRRSGAAAGRVPQGAARARSTIARPRAPRRASHPGHLISIRRPARSV